MAAASICTAPYMCSEPKHAANHGARSVLAAKKMKGGYEMDLGYVTVGMVLTLLVLFIAEGLCTALREKGGGS